MKNSEKNTIKKDKRIISLKEKFLIKTVEEDNSLSIDKMFSESSYSNFIIIMLLMKKFLTNYLN